MVIFVPDSPVFIVTVFVDVTITTTTITTIIITIATAYICTYLTVNRIPTIAIQIRPTYFGIRINTMKYINIES
jgi:hypothetical protein